MDWPTIATLATPFVVLVLTLLAERRPSVLSHFSNISSFTIQQDPPPNLTINHHTVVVTNSGRKAATGIRLRHRILPEQLNISPQVEHTIDRRDNGGGEIIIPRLRPKESVQIAYMYGTDLRYDLIHDGIVHDEGFARQIAVIPQRQYPGWYTGLAGFFALAGLMLAVYWSVRLVMWLWTLLP